MQKYQSKYEMSGISEGKVLQYALILATVQCLEIHHILLLLSLYTLSRELIRFTVVGNANLLRDTCLHQH